MEERPVEAIGSVFCTSCGRHVPARRPRREASMAECLTTTLKFDRRDARGDGGVVPEGRGAKCRWPSA
jgi:hypothetical protein